ncbi:MAG: DUF808 domain-containing protein [Pseudomonadota bacterium]
MASVGLLALIDDIAVLLDDVAVLTKVAAKKTAGVLGDDLALNAEQVSGVKADRELPVVWAVAKGSALNKLILVPVALFLSVYVSWSVIPLLMLGGAFLCYEGFEKIFHKLFASDHDHDREETLKRLSDPDIDLVAFEKEKIKGAIRTDFILSAEILVIALNAAKDASFETQAMVISLIAIIVTVVVYGLVAVIVKLDDVGLYLLNSSPASESKTFKQRLGGAILAFCPMLMKTLSVVGTAAMFLVGGGILMHGIPQAHHLVEHVGSLGGVVGLLGPTAVNGIGGVIAGALVFVMITSLKKIKSAF